MKTTLGKCRKQKVNRGPLRATLEICARVKVYGTTGTGGGEATFRILEDNDFRITENGDFRVLE